MHNVKYIVHIIKYDLLFCILSISPPTTFRSWALFGPLAVFVLIIILRFLQTQHSQNERKS